MLEQIDKFKGWFYILYIKFLSISVWKSHGRCKYIYVNYSLKNLKIVYRQQIDALVYSIAKQCSL